ncbi:MAG: Holliday junction resolvase RuvX [Anaerolineales bacterium]|jgi:putative Holliday junction resolvase
MRILGVDPGTRRIGVALSDPRGVVARGLLILRHESLASDADRLVRLATENAADRVVVGVATDSEGGYGPQANRAMRLVAALRLRCPTPIETWDESFSTEAARKARLERGDRRKTRRTAIDALAAAAMLQDYLDAHPSA